MTNTSSGGQGISMENAKVELFDVALKGCASAGLFLPGYSSATILAATRCEFANSVCGATVEGSLASATFNNCVFHDNREDGIYASECTIHLHGEATAIHSNRFDGIHALDICKVVIHLPSHHNTFYNNRKQDRRAVTGGTITNVED